MNYIKYFKSQAKKFYKDFQTQYTKENDYIYSYKPKFWLDIDDIIVSGFIIFITDINTFNKICLSLGIITVKDINRRPDVQIEPSVISEVSKTYLLYDHLLIGSTK